MEPQTIIARRIARELSPGMLVNLGIGIPTQVANHVPAGMHVFFRIWDGEGRAVKEGRAGMLNASVPPGESYEVTMVLPPLVAGTYWLAVDLIEEGHICLSQLGAEPWEEEFVVHE